MVCSQQHTHLRLPVSEAVGWKPTPQDPEFMWVGGELVTGESWLEAIKKEWQLDEKSLKAQESFTDSVRILQRAWRVKRKLTRRKTSLEQSASV